MALPAGARARAPSAAEQGCLRHRVRTRCRPRLAGAPRNARRLRTIPALSRPRHTLRDDHRRGAPVSVLLVAGAGEGLGRAIAQRFAREGYVAALVARDGTKLQALAAEGGGQGVPAHLSREAEGISLYERG